MNKPPDPYKCIKVPIKNIFKKQEDNSKILNILEDAVLRTNKIIIKTYLLLRLWSLEKYHASIEIPEITEDTIKFAMKAISTKQKDARIKGAKKDLLNEFIQLSTFIEKEDAVNLSGTLQAYQTTMLTSIENNISLHFIDYINRFINSYFTNLYTEELKSKSFEKELSKDLYLVKKDIINETTLCKSKYHDFLNSYRNKIIPNRPSDCISHYIALKKYPQIYFKSMIFMNIYLENISGKMFQFFPLQTNVGFNNIQIDTKQLIDLFIETDQNIYLQDIEKHKEFLWSMFDIRSCKNFKDYIFSHTIITDGHTVSIRFIHKDHYIKDQLKKLKMSTEKKRRAKLTPEQKNQENDSKKNKQQLKKNKVSEEILKKKENKENKKNVTIPLIPLTKEFQYINEVDRTKLNPEDCLFIDPGKHSLLTVVDINDKFLFYTNKQRLHETKRIVYSNKLQRYKDSIIREDISISKIENELKDYNSKTCSIEKFKEYINKKLEINEILRPLYKESRLDIKLKKYKWYSYINTKRANDNLLNLIEKTYGPNKTIIIGDWSVGQQMAHFISTPNITLKRELTRKFKVLVIDEFRTSCLHHKTDKYVENLHLPDKTNKTQKLHQVLTYQMENNRKGCINRDKNGVLNIKKLGISYIKTGHIPVRYRRTTVL